MIPMITPSNGSASAQGNMDSDPHIIKIAEFARSRGQSPSHGFDHIQRVYNLAKTIGKAERCDMKTLLAAALLHDIGRDIEDGIGADHADTSAYFGKDFLKSIDFPKEKINPVFNAIKQHRTSAGDPPQSKEAKVLSDADNLDALGAIGVARAFTYGGQHERNVRGTIRHFRTKLIGLRDRMYTDTARRLAERRAIYVERFLMRLDEEVHGLK